MCMSYTPLHVYSGYSLQKSALKIDDYCKYLCDMNFTSAAITDYESLTATPVFYHLAKKQNIKTIVGEDFIISNLLITFIVQNETGYKSLLLFSNAKHSNELTLDFVKEHQSGLYVILSTENLALKKSYLENKDAFSHKLAKVCRGFSDFYIGIDMSDLSFGNEMRDFCYSHGYKTVAFPHIKYLKKEDAIALKMVECIDSKEVLTQKKLNGNNYLLSCEEVEKLYTKEEIEQTNIIASSINFELVQKRGDLVKFDCPNGLNSDEYLKELSFEGLKSKKHTDQKYIDRLNYELSVIKQMGYSDYFLVVQDYIKFARNHNIAVGPGRGSASGSLVAHCLDITVPDPLEYDLLFERFLNPSRQTMPDIDVDFSDVDRDKVVDYISRKYGTDHTAKIIAVQTIGAKQSFHDVAKIFGYDQHDIDLFLNIIKDEKFDKLTLREIYKNSKDFRDLVNNDKYYLEIVTLASKIEGLPRQTSLHAVGIVLNSGPLENVIPLSYDEDGSLIEQFEKDYIEEQGILKMDILAISNLTIIDECLYRLSLRGINLKRDEIPYKDQDAINLIAKGQTIGVFQLDTPKFRSVLKTFKPSNFDDVVALLALNRPGPKANIPIYVARKDGKQKVTYPHPALKEILAPTYGILVYQEQVMQVASKMAGFSLAEADLLRRAISKKDSSILKGMQVKFIEGAKKKGYSEIDALNVFKLIYKFGDYGFNKSHSVVYSIFSCRMEYLKAHYPEEFYASILSNAGSEEFNNTILEMKGANIDVCVPDINTSESYFNLINHKILFPLSQVKAISLSMSENIIQERKAKPFDDIFDFVLRMSKYKISDQQIINLIDAGCFDSINPSRASLRANVSSAVAFADVFGGENVSILDPTMFAKPTFITARDDYLENLNREQNVLGFMVSGSPLDLAKDTIKKLNAITLSELPLSKGYVKTVAILKRTKKIKAKSKKDMAFINVFDNTGEVEMTLFEEALIKSSDLKKSKIVVIYGKYNQKRNEFTVDKLIRLEDLKNE